MFLGGVNDKKVYFFVKVIQKMGGCKKKMHFFLKFNIFLMPEGEKTFETVLPVVKEIRRQGWGELNEEDYEHFVRIMDSIYQNFSN